VILFDRLTPPTAFYRRIGGQEVRRGSSGTGLSSAAIADIEKTNSHLTHAKSLYMRHEVMRNSFRSCY
jgi:hypothetical protein